MRDDQVEAWKDLTMRCGEVLHGCDDRTVQSGVLAELLAVWLVGDGSDTDEWRARLLVSHVELVVNLSRDLLAAKKTSTAH